ncbi:MAG: GNAT family N-acetyltransferase [Rhizobiales bacterium]|nr:GNAT family N-acetyltransferase [Hyphomicrobiales bacterium]
MRPGPGSLSIGPALAEEVARLHTINEASTPGVGSLPLEDFPTLLALADTTLVARILGEAAGFILLMVEGNGYASENYRWISQRRARFAYVDRIAIAPEFRGQAIGHALYEAALETYSGRRETLICEVNLSPPNPGSLRFHERLGFAAFGERWSADRTKGVVYLELAIAPGGNDHR